VTCILAVHVNFLAANKPEGFDLAQLDETDRKLAKGMEDNQKWEFAYLQVGPEDILSGVCGQD